jgi:hypothetical protein
LSDDSEKSMAQSMDFGITITTQILNKEKLNLRA